MSAKATGYGAELELFPAALRWGHWQSGVPSRAAGGHCGPAADDLLALTGERPSSTENSAV